MIKSLMLLSMFLCFIIGLSIFGIDGSTGRPAAQVNIAQATAINSPLYLPYLEREGSSPPTVAPSPTVAEPSSTPTATPTSAPISPFKVLVFSKTAGFRHPSINVAIPAIANLGVQHNFVVDATEDAAKFTDANLAQYKAVVFLMTTGDVLNDQQQAAFERYIRAGNGYAGIHAASDTEYDWPWYGGLVGAYFSDHPAIQNATIHVEDDGHTSTEHLPERWTRNDEWYNFRSNPRGKVKVLATLDEFTYRGGTMGDHPIVWYHEYDGGRSWYTGGGHTEESYAEPLFLQHILGGIRYAAGVSATPTPVLDTWTSLFNGQNLDGWYTWLPSTGRNNDPQGVFKVRDGIIHILDIPLTADEQEFGYLATVNEYENYHLRFQYRWGTKKFAPRAELKRDSGLLYHMTGQDVVWPRSVEAQVQEGDTGDLVLLGTSASTTVESLSEPVKRYKDGGVPYTSQVTEYIFKQGTYDSLTDWNTVEIIASGDTLTHIVNGRVVHRATDIRQPDPNDGSKLIPLNKGRILLQAEGAEIMYRNIEIRPLR